MKAAIIDPGGDLSILEDACKQLGVTLEQIWITHAHIDHAGGTANLAEKLGLPIIGPHEGDQFWIDGLAQAAASYHFPLTRIHPHALAARWRHGHTWCAHAASAPLPRPHPWPCGVLLARNQACFCR